MQPRAEAKRLIKKFGSEEAIRLCDYFKDNQIPKIYFYWCDVKQEIKNIIEEL
jgi:hypothetical protein